MEIRFAIAPKRLRFESRNTLADPVLQGNIKEIVKGKGGSREKGIGVANTLRRLEIIYENKFHYRAGIEEGMYVVELEIPLRKHAK